MKVIGLDRQEKNNVNISITITWSLKRILDKIVVTDTHISYGDFFREAAREKIKKDYPKYAKELGWGT